jgi:hypothetical protein
VIVEEIMTLIFADVCVMAADGLSSVIYYYYSFWGFLFQLGDNGPYLLETHYCATLYTFISLHLKEQHSVAVFLSSVTVDLLCLHTIDCSNEHITADKQQVILYTFFIMNCQKVFEHADIYVMFVQCFAPHKLCELQGEADFHPCFWK